MMRQTRTTLLKIPEVLSVKCGKRIDPECEWPFFLAVDVESMDKLAMYRDDAFHVAAFGRNGVNPGESRLGDRGRHLRSRAVQVGAARGDHDAGDGDPHAHHGRGHEACGGSRLERSKLGEEERGFRK